MTPKPPTKKTQSKEAPLNADRAGVFSVSFRVASLFQKAAGGVGAKQWVGECNYPCACCCCCRAMQLLS